MNNKEKQEKANVFYKAMIADEELKKEFIANPILVLKDKNILTSEDIKIPGVDDYYKLLAEKISKQKPDTTVHTHTNGVIVMSFWSDAACWGCKISSGAIVAAAIGGATLATGGLDIAVLAAALEISEVAAGAAVAAGGGSVAELTGLLLTVICGDC